MIVCVLVKVFNCELGLDKGFCLDCCVCQEIMVGVDFDVIEVDVVIYFKVEQVCEFIESLCYGLVCDCYKVVVIDEIYCFLCQVFDVLLKIVEELLLYLIFIFVMMEIEVVFVMIFLWCQEFYFCCVFVEMFVVYFCKFFDVELIDVSDIVF